MNQSAMIRTLQPVISGAVSTEPVSLCTHPRHVEWWNCPVEQPASQFYPHTNKCKRCYIRQQQDKKKQKHSTGSIIIAGEEDANSVYRAATPMSPSSSCIINYDPLRTDSTSNPETLQDRATSTPIQVYYPTKQPLHKALPLSVLAQAEQKMCCGALDAVLGRAQNSANSLPADFISALSALRRNAAAGVFKNVKHFVDEARAILNHNQIEIKENPSFVKQVQELQIIFERLIPSAFAEESAFINEIPSNVCNTCGVNDNRFLLRCSGNCLRVFHMECLFPQPISQDNWLCSECLAGRVANHNIVMFDYCSLVAPQPYAAVNTATPEQKINLRKEQDLILTQNFYYDPVWCTWRQKPSSVMKPIVS